MLQQKARKAEPMTSCLPGTRRSSSRRAPRDGVPRAAARAVGGGSGAGGNARGQGLANRRLASGMSSLTEARLGPTVVAYRVMRVKGEVGYALLFGLCLGVALLASCPSPRGAPSDLAAPDLRSHGQAPDGGAPCGDGVCKPNQLCVHPCPPALPCDMSGPSHGPCTPQYCRDIPTACGGGPDCACFVNDPCDTNGSCQRIDTGVVTCAMCPF